MAGGPGHVGQFERNVAHPRILRADGKHYGGSVLMEFVAQGEVAEAAPAAAVSA
jgi:hypothetical protein